MLAEYYGGSGNEPRGASNYIWGEGGSWSMPDGTVIIYENTTGGGGNGAVYWVYTPSSGTFTQIPAWNSGGQIVRSQGGYTWYSDPRHEGGGYWVKPQKPVTLTPAAPRD